MLIRVPPHPSLEERSWWLLHWLVRCLTISSVSLKVYREQGVKVEISHDGEWVTGTTLELIEDRLITVPWKPMHVRSAIQVSMLKRGVFSS